MKTTKKKTLYWIAKGWISFFMFFSAYYSFTHAEALKLLGFPAYFRMELVLAKSIGGFLLLIPQTPLRVKEWIYAGFGIEMISALIAHIVNSDPLPTILFVSVDFMIIATCIWYVSKQEQITITINQERNYLQ
jgi:hypothetical protein